MKNTLLLFVCCALAGALNGQNIVYGVSAGFNLSKLKFSEGFQDGFSQQYGASYSTNALFGFQGGLRFGIQLGENNAIFLEPTIIQSGSKWETDETYEVTLRNGTNTLGFVKFKEKYTTIKVPLLARVKLLGDRFALTATAGPSVNITFAGKGEAVIETPQKTEPYYTYELKFGKNRTDDYNNIGVSLILAPGFVYKVDDEGRIRVTFETRFDIGLSDMYTQKRKDFLYAGGIEILGTQKQRSTMFTIGVEFWPWY